MEISWNFFSPKKWEPCDLIEIIQFCLNIYDLLDILDIFLDILLKPPQPLMGLFLSYIQGTKSTREPYTSDQQHSTSILSLLG